MSRKVYITERAHLDIFIDELKTMSIPEHGFLIGIETGKATTKQKGCVHIYCRLLAKELADAGYDMKEVLKVDAEIPPDEYMVKKLVWNKVMEAMTGKTSITELDRKEVNEIYTVIQKHMAQSFSIMVPFPSNEPPMI